jgi:hypothetical protein
MVVLALRGTLVAGATTLAACGATSPSREQTSTTSTTAATAPAPRGDAFKGAITAATGRFAGERGDITIVLSHPPRGGDSSTSLTLSILGAGCGGRPHCVSLNGRLSGRMTLLHSLPDVGHRFDIGARGTVTSLGPVEASGITAGTGFIRIGHTELNLTLQSASGTVTVEGLSGPVPGRTDP